MSYCTNIATQYRFTTYLYFSAAVEKEEKAADDAIDMFAGKVIELRRARGQAGMRVKYSLSSD